MCHDNCICRAGYILNVNKTGCLKSEQTLLFFWINFDKNLELFKAPLFSDSAIICLLYTHDSHILMTHPNNKLKNASCKETSYYLKTSDIGHRMDIKLSLITSWQNTTLIFSSTSFRMNTKVFIGICLRVLQPENNLNLFYSCL